MSYCTLRISKYLITSYISHSCKQIDLRHKYFYRQLVPVTDLSFARGENPFPLKSLASNGTQVCNELFKIFLCRSSHTAGSPRVCQGQNCRGSASASLKAASSNTVTKQEARDQNQMLGKSRGEKGEKPEQQHCTKQTYHLFY